MVLLGVSGGGVGQQGEVPSERERLDKLLSIEVVLKSRSPRFRVNGGERKRKLRTIHVWSRLGVRPDKLNEGDGLLNEQWAGTTGQGMARTGGRNRG